jgi:hypothetical protein
MFCPTCSVDYRDGSTICPTCQVALVNEAPYLARIDERERALERETWERDRSRGWLTIIVSIVGSLGFIYVALARASGSMMAIFLTAAFTCYVLYIVGCCNVARGKGYSPALGLIGLFGVFGIIVLAVMPQKKIEV